MRNSVLAISLGSTKRDPHCFCIGLPRTSGRPLAVTRMHSVNRSIPLAISSSSAADRNMLPDLEIPAASPVPARS